MGNPSEIPTPRNEAERTIRRGFRGARRWQRAALAASLGVGALAGLQETGSNDVLPLQETLIGTVIIGGAAVVRRLVAHRRATNAVDEYAQSIGAEPEAKYNHMVIDRNGKPVEHPMRNPSNYLSPVQEGIPIVGALMSIGGPAITTFSAANATVNPESRPGLIVAGALLTAGGVVSNELAVRIDRTGEQMYLQQLNNVDTNARFRRGQDTAPFN